MGEYPISNNAELYTNSLVQEDTAYDEPAGDLDSTQMPNPAYSAEQPVYDDPESDEEDEQFMGFAEAKPKEGLYALFNKVLTLPKTTKVGNVDKEELGHLGISIRECLRVALIGKTFGHRKFAEFFENQANIITDTSMAKRGWFSELFVTAKRFTEKASGGGSPQIVGIPAKESEGKLGSFFNKKK